MARYEGGLTLGEVIEALEAVPPVRRVVFGWLDACSYRGYYDCLALSVACDIDCGTMLRTVRGAVGQTMPGWKGGEYAMTRDTEVYLVGDASETGVPLTREMLSRLLAWEVERDDGSLEEPGGD